MKRCILIVFITFMLFTSGCLKTPSETMRIPEYSRSDRIFNGYKKMLQENKPPKDLLVYLDRNISKLHKNSADIAVIRIIELQKKQQVKYEEKLLEEVDYVKQLQDIENNELHDIPDPRVRYWVKEVMADGFNISTSSGSPKIEIDYEKINKIADKYVTAELKDYIKIESEESSKKYSEQKTLDSYLTAFLAKQYDGIEMGSFKENHNVINFIKELSVLLDLTFKYTNTYKDSPYKIRVNELKSEYLKTFFFGSPNNSTFTYYQGYDKKDNKIVPEWDKAYENTKKDYSDGYFGIYVSNYYQELLKNNKILNKDLYDTINKKINNPD